MHEKRFHCTTRRHPSCHITARRHDGCDGNGFIEFNVQRFTTLGERGTAVHVVRTFRKRGNKLRDLLDQPSSVLSPGETAHTARTRLDASQSVIDRFKENGREQGNGMREYANVVLLQGYKSRETCSREVARVSSSIMKREPTQERTHSFAQTSPAPKSHIPGINPSLPPSFLLSTT